MRGLSASLVCWAEVCLDIKPRLALVLLELAAGGPECISHGEIRVLMSVMDCNLRIGQRDVDAQLMHSAPMPVGGRRLDYNVASHYSLTEFLESRGEPTDASFERGRGGHVTKGDLQGGWLHTDSSGEWWSGKA